MDDLPESQRRDFPSISTSWLSLGVVLVTFILLPERTLGFSEELWKLQQKLRRELGQVARSVSGNPIVRAILDAAYWLLRKLSGGRFSSPCLPPHSLRARLGGPTEVLVLWTAHQQPNPLHEETYILSWKVGGGKGSAWQEEAITENLCTEIGGARDRWGAILDLPEEAVTRIRVCAVNHLGRGEWSHEEVEVTTTRAKPGSKIRVVLAKGVRTCTQCANPIGKEPGAVAYAQLVCRSVFHPDCKHGPFCPKCRERVAQKVLPCCVCRGLIESWRQGSAEDAESES
ncbi:unnamed protein product [Symbiodinium natans]|uniref:Fibronectin type-III domain-containing protein n=1 Tax=Symbiodinium natans TaxID=878477 RepID=A0A812KYZ1_9DINO|nr:unnamed protein product [Symbiodinium natans]